MYYAVCVCVCVCVNVCVFTVHVLLHYHRALYTNLSHSRLLCKQARHCDKVNLALLKPAQHGE